MRFVSFDGQRIGVLDGQQVIDLTGMIEGSEQEWPPLNMVRAIAAFPTLESKLGRLVRGAVGVPISSVRLTAPVQWPNKVIAYPTNYHDHMVEMGSSQRSDHLGFFLKASSSLCGPDTPIVLPAVGDREVHHEAELAVIVGRPGRHIAVDEAHEFIFGYSCLMDVTVRGSQERVMRKSFDTFCPMGPTLVTRDEVTDPDCLEISLSVNGEQRQRANTRDMILDVASLVSLASSVATLYPGDVIATGTPAGVGPLRDGDTVSMSISEVGELTMHVVQGTGGSNVVFEAG